ncbi:MAG: hypothetical protein NT118_09835, partial [Lentisphaerae bacterium]|nr:hypothetical protein [Lentisphaerota bacterium]
PVSGMLLTSKPDNFLNYGDKIDARLKVMSQANASGKARVTAKDFYSENLFDKTFDFKCDKDGIAEIALPFDNKFPEGIFVVKADYTLDDGRKDYDFFRFSVMKFLENKHRLKNIFSYTFGDYSGMANYPQILERYKYIGAGALACMHSWRKDVQDLHEKYGMTVMMTRMATNFIETAIPINDGYLFSLLSSCPQENGGVSLRDYRYNDPKAELTEKYLREFEDAVAKNAKDNPRVKAWKIDSELREGGRYGMTKDDFTKLQIAFYRGVKKGNPNAVVMQGGPCNMRPQGGIKDLEEDLKLWSAVKYDLVGIHPYREKPEEPDLDSDTAYLLDMLKKNNYGDAKVVWDESMCFNQYQIPQLGFKCADWIFGAWGWGPLSYDMGWWEKISASWRARSWLVALKYQDKVLTFSSGGQNNFSMDAYLTPYASQKIPNTLGNLLGNAYFKEDIRFAPYSRCYIFEDEQKRPVAAVWGYHAKLDDGTIPPFQASANFNGQTPEIFDLMGAGREAKADAKGNIAFPISSFPLFFRGKSGTLNTFVTAFKNAGLLSAEGIMPVEMQEDVASPDSMNITIKNLVSKQYDGKLGVNDASYSLKIPPAGKSVISVKMPNSLKDNAVVGEKMKFQLTDLSTNKDFKSFTEFKGFVCHKTKNNIVIDGNLHYPDTKINDADFSASFKTVWNEKGIYLAVKVTDDKFVHNEKVELYDGKNPWHNRCNNDALQVYFDTLCDARKQEAKGYGIDDYEYGIFPNSAGDSSVVYRYVTPDIQLTIGDKAPKPGTIAKEISSAFKKTKDGYVYEVFFPATWVLPIRLEKGYVAGFGIFLNDRDSLEEKDTKSLTLTPPGTGCYNNPHLWPVILLWE